MATCVFSFNLSKLLQVLTDCRRLRQPPAASRQPPAAIQPLDRNLQSDLLTPWHTDLAGKAGKPDGATL